MSRHAVLIAVLYALEGIPYGVQTNLLPLTLRTNGMQLYKVTFLHLLNVPWLAKGYIASYRNNRLSRRLTVCTLLCLQGLCFFLFNNNFTRLVALLLLLNLATALLDVEVDSIVVGWASDENVGWYNSVQVVAYKLGVIGSSALALHDVGWSHVTCLYFLVASVVWLEKLDGAERNNRQEQEDARKKKGDKSGNKTTEDYGNTDIMASNEDINDEQLIDGMSKERDNSNAKDVETKDFFNTLAELFSNPGSRQIALLCLMYKAGEKCFTSTHPLLLLDKRGVNKETLAFVGGVIGQTASLIGSIAGGIFFNRTIWSRSAFVFCFLSMLFHLLHAVALPTQNLAIYCLLETCLSVTSGFITTWTFSKMMMSAKTNVRESSQTLHYSVLSTLELGGKIFVSSVSGICVQYMGYYVFLAICVAFQCYLMCFVDVFFK